MIELLKKHRNLVLLYVDDVMGISKVASSFEGRCFDFGVGVSNMIYASLGFLARSRMPVLCGNAWQVLIKGGGALLESVCDQNMNVKMVLACEKGAIEKQKELFSAFKNLEVLTVDGEADLNEKFDKMLDRFGPVCLLIELG